jgi:colanic acid/amylovoran biosynthesis glycosyltransferase
MSRRISNGPVDPLARPLRIAYLCAQYPAISHTFVLKEVIALRAQGAEVATFSVRRASQEHLLAADDIAAYDTTYAILPPQWAKLLAAHLTLLRSSPRSYLSGILLAMRLAPDGLRGRIWQLFYFVEAVVLWNECRAKDIHHIHVHLANVAADVALLAVHIGTSADPTHEYSWSFTMHGPTEFSDVSAHRLATKVELARFVVCISDYTRSQLMTLSDPAMWSKLHVVHVGVPTERFDPGGSAETKIANRILCVGRLVPEKGHAVLLQAVAELARRGLDVDLDLVGDGPAKASLELLAARFGIGAHVKFHGAVGQDDIREFYARASLFCMPSFAEGLPGVLMEAMAMELAVISTRITGVPELITDGVDGLLVSPARPDQLADAIRALLDDHGYARELGQRARAKVLSDFNASRCGEEIRALFEAELSAPDQAAS